MSSHNFKMISQSIISYIMSRSNYRNSIYYVITKSKINYLDRKLRIIVRIIYGFKRKDRKSIIKCFKCIRIYLYMSTNQDILPDFIFVYNSLFTMFTLFNTKIRICQCCQLYVNVVNSMDRWMDRLDG